MLAILRNSSALVSFASLIAASQIALGNICETVKASSKKYVEFILGKS